MDLVLAIVIGLAFGFVLNRVGATNPENIINMLRLKDLRLMKTILFAVGLAATTLFVGMSAGFIDPGHLSVKSSYLGVVIGGAVLGIGFAISGYCPGTGLAAAATGRKDAWIFAAGGLLGALAFTLSYGFLKDSTTWFDKIAGGSVTLAQTGNEKYASLFPDVSGLAIGLGVGVALMVVAWILPRSILKGDA